jgi:hypothetical protein
MDFVNQSLMNVGGAPLSNVWYAKHSLIADAFFTSVNVVSDSEIYATMGGGSSDSYAYFVKLNSTGQHEWIYRMKYPGGDVLFRAKKIIKSGDYLYGVIGGDNGNAIVKLNLDGTPVWIKSLYATSSNSATLNGITILGSDIYVSGFNLAPSGGNYCGFVARFNDSGILQWQKFYSVSSVDVVFQAIDSYSGAIFLAGREGSKSLVVSINTSGTLQFKKTFVGPSGGNDEAYGISSTKSSSGTTYVCGKTYNSSSTKNNGYIMAIDPNGFILSQDIISDGSQDIVFNEVSSSGNPRVVGTLGTETALVQKFQQPPGFPLSLFSEYKISLATGTCMDIKGSDVFGGGYSSSPLLFRYTDSMSKPKTWGVRAVETISPTEDNSTVFTTAVSTITESTGLLVSATMIVFIQGRYTATSYEVNNGANSI